MDSGALLLALLNFVRPRNLADLFIDQEATLFLPILYLGWVRGWFRRLPYYMDRMLGLEHLAKCPKCHTEFDAS